MSREAWILFRFIEERFGPRRFTFRELQKDSPGQCNTPSRSTLSRGLVTELVKHNKIKKIEGFGVTGVYEMRCVAQ